MSYTSFEGFDGNPREKETWLMLRQAFEERGVQIARPEKYSIVQERMFKQMKDGIDNLPKYKWQDGDIVEATHNDNADYEFRKIPHGSALGKETKLQYFANACKKELCERTIKHFYYGFRRHIFSATHTVNYGVDRNDWYYTTRYFDLNDVLTYTLSNAYGVSADVYVVFEYTYTYEVYENPRGSWDRTLLEEGTYSGRGVNSMLPNTPYLLGRVEDGENLTAVFQVGSYILSDAAQFFVDDATHRRRFYLYAEPTFYFDFDYTMK